MARFVPLLVRMTSLATRTYFAAPVWMQHAMISAYGAHLRRQRYGAAQRRCLAAIRDTQWAPAAVVQQRQLDELNRVLRRARATVPLYADRIPGRELRALGELSTIPLLRKAEVRAAGRAATSTAIGESTWLEVHTGGTTGTPLTVYCDRPTLQRNYAFFARFLESAGLGERARVATFAGRVIVPPGRASPPYWRYNVAGHAMLCSSYHIGPATVGDYADALARFRPEFIDSYPSSIAPIARHLVARGDTRIRPRAIVTSSETLTAPVRALLEEAFDCPVFDHYGAAEMAALITQCREGLYHCNSDYGVVEVIRDGRPVRAGETGEIVATGFINPVMPFIRYATGDLAVRADSTPCACGSPFPALTEILGREDDVLVTPEGHRVGRLDPIFKSVASLTETRIVQDATDHVRVEIVSEAALRPGELAELQRGLHDRLGPSMRIEFVRLPRLERSASGKSRSVVNLVTASRP
ncbi:MAG: phenylacetate--CoA ligase family protein [Gemmatimonadaceae bacterium]